MYIHTTRVKPLMHWSLFEFGEGQNYCHKSAAVANFLGQSKLGLSSVNDIGISAFRRMFWREWVGSMKQENCSIKIT